MSKRPIKTSKDKVFIIILALVLGGLLSFIPADIFATSGPVTVSLTTNPLNINKGEKTNLSWNSTNSDFCVAYSGWFGARAVSGNETVVPRETTTFKINCSNSSGFLGTAQVTVTVGETSSSLVGVNISASPEAIFRGESTTLIWSSTNATSCEASGGWSGIKSTHGSETVSPSITYSYTLKCNNNLGQYASDTQTIFVNPSGSTGIIPSSGQFSASCVAEPNKASVGQTVIFAGAQSKGAGPVSYRWSGDVSGNTQTVRTSFTTSGTKTAQLIVADATGKTTSAICSIQVGSGITPLGPIIRTSKILPPTNLRPNGVILPSDATTVDLQWDEVSGALTYAIRADIVGETIPGDSKNNCPGNPHYLCVNGLNKTSISLTVESGKTYNWWIHTVGSNGVFSDPTFASFSVAEKELAKERSIFASIFLTDEDELSGWGILILLTLIIVIIFLITAFGREKREKEELIARQEAFLRKAL